MPRLQRLVVLHDFLHLQVMRCVKHHVFHQSSTGLALVMAVLSMLSTTTTSARPVND